MPSGRKSCVPGAQLPRSACRARGSRQFLRLPVVGGPCLCCVRPQPVPWGRRRRSRRTSTPPVPRPTTSCSSWRTRRAGACAVWLLAGFPRGAVRRSHRPSVPHHVAWEWACASCSPPPVCVQCGARCGRTQLPHGVWRVAAPGAPRVSFPPPRAASLPSYPHRCSVASPEYLKLSVQTDPHPPAKVCLQPGGGGGRGGRVLGPGSTHHHHPGWTPAHSPRLDTRVGGWAGNRRGVSVEALSSCGVSGPTYPSPLGTTAPVTPCVRALFAVPRDWAADEPSRCVVHTANVFFWLRDNVVCTTSCVALP